MKRIYLIAGILTVLLIGVGSFVAAQDDDAPNQIPLVTPGEACVPPEQIVFDTFNGGYVPFSEASTDTILQLRDAIPPIDNPQYETNPTWLNESDLLMGYIAEEGAFAYPFRILNFHEIINEEIDGLPVLISYCPLCGSGIVFSRELDGEVLTFGNTSALYESDMVMYDHQTGSYWHQVGGIGIVGDYCEQTLNILPSSVMTWGEWHELYPDSLVLSRDTGFNRNYDRNPFISYQEYLNEGNFAFPVSEAAEDPRLLPGEWVLGLEIGTERRAYPLPVLLNTVTEDVLNGERIVIFGSDENAVAYFAQDFDFEWQDGRIIDRQTQSEWELSGLAINGEQAGTQLEPVPTRRTYWFSLVATYPEIEIYEAVGSGVSSD